MGNGFLWMAMDGHPCQATSGIDLWESEEMALPLVTAAGAEAQVHSRHHWVQCFRAPGAKPLGDLQGNQRCYEDDVPDYWLMMGGDMVWLVFLCASVPWLLLVGCG